LKGLKGLIEVDVKESSELEMVFRQVYRKLKDKVQKSMRNHVSPNEFIVLKYLLEGPMRASELSKKLQVSASHITTVTDSLVEKELIERSRSTQDRRVVDLMINDKGTALVRDLIKVKSDLFKETFKVFSQEEIQILINLFKKLDSELTK
jgi:DNA-binding MarR family transcriptional regulator